MDGCAAPVDGIGAPGVEIGGGGVGTGGIGSGADGASGDGAGAAVSSVPTAYLHAVCLLYRLCAAMNHHQAADPWLLLAPW